MTTPTFTLEQYDEAYAEIDRLLGIATTAMDDARAIARAMLFEDTAYDIGYASQHVSCPAPRNKERNGVKRAAQIEARIERWIWITMNEPADPNRTFYVMPRSAAMRRRPAFVLVPKSNAMSLKDIRQAKIVAPARFIDGPDLVFVVGPRVLPEIEEPEIDEPNEPIA